MRRRSRRGGRRSGCARAHSRGRARRCARTSITPQASAGTVFLTSPACSWVATAVMPGRAPWSSFSIRSSSRASARSAERPSSGEVPACAGTPCAVIVTQHPALRAVTIAPDSRPHSRHRAASAPCMVLSVNGATLRPSSSGTQCSSTATSLSTRRSSAARPTSTPPFMSATPGPCMRSPSLRTGRAAAVPTGNTVSWWPSKRMRPAPLPCVRATTCNPTGDGSRSTAQPASSAHSAIRVAQASRPAR